jgi:iron(III) transport system permease protein
VTIAIALIFVFLNPPFNSLGIYGTIWILVIGLVTQYIAFGTRLMNGAVVQIQKELEEAANVSGAASLAIMWRITLPLLMPSFIAGWIWVAAHALRAFSVPLVLSSSRNEVVAARIWAIWSDGQYNEAAALGVMMLIILFPLTLLMRRFMANVKD